MSQLCERCAHLLSVTALPSPHSEENSYKFMVRGKWTVWLADLCLDRIWTLDLRIILELFPVFRLEYNNNNKKNNDNNIFTSQKWATERRWAPPPWAGSLKSDWLIKVSLLYTGYGTTLICNWVPMHVKSWIFPRIETNFSRLLSVNLICASSAFNNGLRNRNVTKRLMFCFIKKTPSQHNDWLLDIINSVYI